MWYVAADVESPDGDDSALITIRPIITYASSTRPYREMKRALFERVGPGVQIFSSSSQLACFRPVEAGWVLRRFPKS